MIECLCGCGTLISEKDKQYRRVFYVRNHDKRKKIGTVFCKCGCGQTMPSRNLNSYRKKLFIAGHQHHLRRMKPEKISCACGCGEIIDNIRRKKDGKPYKVKMQVGHGVRGEKNHFWKGGITELNKNERRRLKARQWRQSVLRRDNYTCQICGARNRRGLGKTVVLNADHIKSWSNFPELRYELSNGRTLCVDCHKKTDNYGGRARSSSS